MQTPEFRRFEATTSLATTPNPRHRGVTAHYERKTIPQTDNGFY